MLNTTASSNTAVGHYSLEYTLSGEHNTAIGGSAGKTNVEGNKNTFLGSWAGMQMQGGNDNTIIGYWARGSAVSTGGNNNVHIGSEAGRSNNGDGNVFLSAIQQADILSGSHQLVIHNNESDNPLIYGIDERKEINGSLSIEGLNFFACRVLLPLSGTTCQS
ncbi:MAG: hypothetical protein IPL63_09200 [Saprospiraceae bacterium]|nr:hypothetical protein [Saprospiraceae bacterium]